MIAHTRYALLAGVGVLGAGLVAGGVAYLSQGGALVAQTGPDELQYLPSDARVVAYANVREVMQSSFRARLREVDPAGLSGRAESSEDDASSAGPRWFQQATGVNLETDVDDIVVSLVPGETATDLPKVLALLVGRFDRARLEALARDHGGIVQQDGEYTIVTAVPTVARLDDALERLDVTSGDAAEDQRVAMTFVESGVLALGNEGMVRGAIDVSRGSRPANVTTNERLMRLMADVRRGHNAWAVAEFDGLEAEALLPENVRPHIPPLTAMAIGGHVNGGIRTTLTVETRDEQAARDLHQVVQGFVALARMQVSSHPELQPLLQSIELVGEGSTVTLGLDVPEDLLDTMFSAIQSAER